MSQQWAFFRPCASLRSIIASQLPPQPIDALADSQWLKSTKSPNAYPKKKKKYSFSTFETSRDRTYAQITLEFVE
jgi:hypothetical protein